MYASVHSVARMLKSTQADSAKVGANHLNDTQNKVLLALSMLTGIGMIGLAIYWLVKRDQVHTKEQELNLIKQKIMNALMTKANFDPDNFSDSIKIELSANEVDGATTVTFTKHALGLQVSFEDSKLNQSELIIAEMSLEKLPGLVLNQLRPVVNELMERNTVGPIESNYGVKPIELVLSH